MKRVSPPTGRAIRCGERLLVAGRVPLVMGVLNVTPDSFSDGGRFAATAEAVRHARAMIAAGADVIDVGGESTRPGASEVGAGEELDRVMPVLEQLLPGGTPVSIDTRKPEVADAALARGCAILNDVGGVRDADMVEVLRRHRHAAVVVMHMKGEPRTMQDAPWYEDVVAEVSGFLRERAGALAAAGIERERVVLDPGIGFGKRYRDNLEILNHVDVFRALGYPVLIGASRKRFLGEILDAPPDRRLPGSLAVAARCMDAGVEMVRVHDVAETVGLFRVLDAIDHPDLEGTFTERD